MKSARSVIFLLAASLLAPACASSSATTRPAPPPAPAPAAAAPIHLTIIGTNDLHGWVEPHREKLSDGTEVAEGGLAAFGGYLAIARAENPGGVLLLDAGDLFQGTLLSNVTEGSVVIDVLNHLGYQASAIGNHEFDYGPAGPAAVATHPDQDPFGALKQRLAQAKFPMLAVNIYDAHSGHRPDWLPNDGTLMLTVQGVKVGILGLVTPATPQTTNPVNVASLRFGSLVPEAQIAAKRLRDHGAELVIAVAHAGGKCASLADPHDIASCDQSNGEIFEMLNGLPPGTLDAVIAGHTHAPMGHYVNGTPVIETWGLGRYFGIIDLYVDANTHALLKDRTQLRPVIPICTVVDEKTGSCDPKRLKAGHGAFVPATFDGKPVTPDQEVNRIVAPALARVDSEQHRKIGVFAPKPLGRNYEAESPLGDVLADSLREMEGADIALLNSGGLRADLPAGDLRYGDVYEVMPFDNTVATLTVTGEELRRLINSAYGARRGVFQVSGLKVKISACPGQGRLRAFTLADGRPISPEKHYRVAVPDFLARGGDGLAPVVGSLPPSRVDLGEARGSSFRDELIAYWQKKKTKLVPPTPGRVQILPDAAACNPGASLDIQGGPAR